MNTITDSRHTLVRVSILMLLLGFAGIASCNSVAAPSKPTIVIVSPPSGSIYSVGEQVAVQSSAADAAGIIKVELLVDGLPARVDPSPISQGQVQFSLIQHWIATTPGAHVLTVRAYNTQGATAEAGVSINVNAIVLPSPTAHIFPLATLAPLPTAPPTATLAPPTAEPTVAPTTALPPTAPATTAPTETTLAPTVATCVLNSQFIADVTIPDGAQMNPGAGFTKTWRVRNNGTCTWDTSFTIAFAGGYNLAGFTQNIIPPTAPGATADISIPMTAPAASGTYSSFWRLRDARGEFFGTTLSAKIIAGSPTATFTVTPSVTATTTALPPPPPPTCKGTPDDFSFTVSDNSITLGKTVTLSWSAITNADGAFLDGEGVSTPGSRKVKPNATTTYTLVATCGNNSRSRVLTVSVSK